MYLFGFLHSLADLAWLLLSSTYYPSIGSGYEEISVHKSSSSQKIDLACQASQYLNFCKSSLQSNANISEKAEPVDIIVAAIVVSQQAITQSYITSRQLLSKSKDENLTVADWHTKTSSTELAPNKQSRKINLNRLI